VLAVGFSFLALPIIVASATMIGFFSIILIILWVVWMFFLAIVGINE
jgi:hypothetical protein